MLIFTFMSIVIVIIIIVIIVIIVMLLNIIMVMLIMISYLVVDWGEGRQGQGLLLGTPALWRKSSSSSSSPCFQMLLTANWILCDVMKNVGEQL